MNSLTDNFKQSNILTFKMSILIFSLIDMHKIPGSFFIILSNLSFSIRSILFAITSIFELACFTLFNISKSS
jgi:hypothetical protein